MTIRQRDSYERNQRQHGRQQQRRHEHWSENVVTYLGFLAEGILDFASERTSSSSESIVMASSNTTARAFGWALTAFICAGRMNGSTKLADEFMHDNDVKI